MSKLPKISREIAIAVAIGVIGIVFLVLLSGDLEIDGSGLKGQPAPEIEFESHDGKVHSISKSKGTVLLLNFWASWCEPCMEEMPSLKALENHYAQKGVVVLAFNIGESPEMLRGKLSGTKMPTNVIYHFNKDALRPYNVNSIPISVIIDAKGIVREVYYGPQDWTSLSILRKLDSLLNKD